MNTAPPRLPVPLKIFADAASMQIRSLPRWRRLELGLVQVPPPRWARANTVWLCPASVDRCLSFLAAFRQALRQSKRALLAASAESAPELNK